MSQGTALGALLEYATDFVDAETAVTYAEVKNCGAYDFPYGTGQKIEVTAHGAAKKKFVPGIIDPGIVSIPIVWDDDETSHDWLMTNLHTKQQFRYTAKDSATPVVFLAIIKSIVAANPVGTGPKERTLVLRRSGGATAAEAA